MKCTTGDLSHGNLDEIFKLNQVQAMAFNCKKWPMSSMHKISTKRFGHSSLVGLQSGSFLWRNSTTMLNLSAPVIKCELKTI